MIYSTVRGIRTKAEELFCSEIVFHEIGSFSELNAEFNAIRIWICSVHQPILAVN